MPGAVRPNLPKYRKVGLSYLVNNEGVNMKIQPKVTGIRQLEILSYTMGFGMIALAMGLFYLKETHLI